MDPSSISSVYSKGELFHNGSKKRVNPWYLKELTGKRVVSRSERSEDIFWRRRWSDFAHVGSKEVKDGLSRTM